MTLLVAKSHKLLILQAYRNTRDMEAAKDVVQESWQAILRKLNSLQDPARFRMWASKIVYNKSVNWIREQQKLRTAYNNHEPDENDENVQPEAEEKVRRAIKLLPREHRVILSMFYTDNYPVSEIAEILALPVGTVKSRLFNARKKLKQIFMTT